MYEGRSAEEQVETVAESLIGNSPGEGSDEVLTGQSLLDKIPESEWQKHSHNPLVAVSVNQQAIVGSGFDENQLFAANIDRFPNEVILIAVSKFYRRSAGAA